MNNCFRTRGGERALLMRVSHCSGSRFSFYVGVGKGIDKVLIVPYTDSQSVFLF